MTETLDSRLDDIRRIAAGMSEERAATLWGEFLASCGQQDDAHQRDGRKRLAPMFPDIWGQSDWCAAAVRLGHMTI